jgi:two-component system, sensor histidine kinase YesM
VNAHSLKVKFVFIFLGITIPLLVILVFQNFYARKVVQNQVADSEHKLMQQFVKQIDKSLGDIDKLLVDFVVNDAYYQTVLDSSNASRYEYSKLQIFKEFEEFSNLHSPFNGLFLYLPNGDIILSSFQSDPALGLSEREVFYKAIRAQYSEQSSHWILDRSGGRDRVIRVLKIDDSLLGAWIDVSNLLQELGDRKSMFLAALDGVSYPDIPLVAADRIDLRPFDAPFKRTGWPDPYIEFSAPSTRGNFCLIGLLPERDLLQSLPSIQYLNYAISLAVICSLFLFYLFFLRAVLRPLRVLDKAMRRLRQGDFSSRIVTARSSQEFDVVHDAFNDMAAQIKGLRINVYEEQLRSHQSELMFLRLQINPHFFLNSLNILYQQAEVGNYALIQDMVKCLSRYFQFVSRTTANFVPLSEEWEHARNYMHIQQLRFPSRLQCAFSALNAPAGVVIPPLLLQTFLENSVTHAMEPDKALSIEVRAAFTPETDTVVVSIRDSGPGFSEPYLSRINGDEAAADTHGHVGIENSRRRLFLLYRNSAKLRFSNAENGGAVVEILLPAKW